LISLSLRSRGVRGVFGVFGGIVGMGAVWVVEARRHLGVSGCTSLGMVPSPIDYNI
jgi:hypothetical protein